ncbi:hypothetical protein GW17_00042829 [Ensete ventricosum]|nr:hypothetical protein GW17_00042829 [Ensete ventricosum]
MKSHQFPAFGCWDHCNELPITQYFESAVQAGLIGQHYFGEDGDLFRVPTQVRPAYHHHHHRKVRTHHPNLFSLQLALTVWFYVKRGGHGGGEKNFGKEQQMKQERIGDLTLQTTPRRPRRAPKAVDEDLYKIPPELLRQKPKRVSPIAHSHPCLHPTRRSYLFLYICRDQTPVDMMFAEEIVEDSVVQEERDVEAVEGTRPMAAASRLDLDGNPIKPMTICLIGAGGFIGSHLCEKLMAETPHTVLAVDVYNDKIKHLLDHPRPHRVPPPQHQARLQARGPHQDIRCAEGAAENGLEFTIVRPFNWIGPSEGVPRVLACFSNGEAATIDVSSKQFYGEGYDDSDKRIPDMTIINKQLAPLLQPNDVMVTDSRYSVQPPGMIGAAGELDCFSAHIRLWEPDKSEDKAEWSKGRGSDDESSGAQLPKSKSID